MVILDFFKLRKFTIVDLIKIGTLLINYPEKKFVFSKKGLEKCVCMYMCMYVCELIFELSTSTKNT